MSNRYKLTLAVGQVIRVAAESVEQEGSPDDPMVEAPARKRASSPPRSARTIPLRLDATVVDQIDEAAAKLCVSRSALIRMVLLDFLAQPRERLLSLFK